MKPIRRMRLLCPYCKTILADIDLPTTCPLCNGLTEVKKLQKASEAQ